MSQEPTALIITFIAPPGGGKGTITQQTEQELNFKSISTGNLCRLHKENNTPLGEQMRECLSQGRLVPDSIISSMVREWLIENAVGTPIILDGYPRSLGQAQELLEMLKIHAASYSFMVIELEIPTDIIVDRLSQRVICSNKSCQRPYSMSELTTSALCSSCNSPLIKRSDDTPEVIRERINVYLQGSALIKKFFADNNITIKKIAVTHESPQEVFTIFKKIITS